MSTIVLTDELLEELANEYDNKKTEEIFSGIYEMDTFDIFVRRRLKEIFL